jgi:thioredoxin-related protein
MVDRAIRHRLTLALHDLGGYLSLMAPYPPPYGFGPPPPSPSPPSDGKAVLSLVLGILSFFICGLTGIPAIVLGFSAKSDIRASGGMVGGSGIATAGIVTGFAGTAMTMLSIGFIVLGVMMGARASSAPTASGPSGTTAHKPAHTAPMAPAAGVHTPSAPATFGTIRVVDLDPEAKETFHQQLATEYKRASGAKQTLLLMTSAKWCSVCREFEDALTDPKMQTALANVSIVRVDIDDFDAELKSEGMLENTLPWFYKLDATLRPVDAISAGEWDDNVPDNMAPVLKSFVSGTLRARRDPSKMGTSL